MLKAFIAVYRSRYWEDSPVRRTVKAYSLVQAQAIAELNPPKDKEDYKLVTIYEPYEVRTLNFKEVPYKAGDCFRIVHNRVTVFIFKILKISKKRVYWEIYFHSSYPPSSIMHRHSVSTVQFKNLWNSRHGSPPTKIPKSKFLVVKKRFKRLPQMNPYGYASHW